MPFREAGMPTSLGDYKITCRSVGLTFPVTVQEAVCPVPTTKIGALGKTLSAYRHGVRAARMEATPRGGMN